MAARAYQSRDRELARQVPLLKWTTILAAGACFAFAALQAPMGRHDNMSFELVIAGMLSLATGLVYRMTGSPKIANRWLAIVSIVCLTYFGWERGGLNLVVIGWAMLIPAATLLLSRQRGWAIVYSSLITAGALVLFGLDAAGMTPDLPPTPAFGVLISFLGQLWGFTIIALIYERGRRKLEKERLRLTDDVAEASRGAIVSRFAGGVAHEINNLLFAVQIHAELAADPETPSEERAEYSQQIADSIKRGARLTEKLLRLTPHTTTATERLDAVAELSALSPWIQKTAGDRIDVLWDLPSHPTTVEWRRTQLEQAVAAIIRNAVDAMPHGGHLRIALEDDADNNEVVIRIEDDGEGMSPEVLAHALDPFYTTRPLGHADGLGLPTADALVRNVGGELDIDSRAGEGTRVLLRLPRAEPGSLTGRYRVLS